MIGGLTLMVPALWCFAWLLERVARHGWEPGEGLRDWLGFAVAMAMPALTVQAGRRYLGKKFPNTQPRVIAGPRRNESKGN